MFEDLESSLNNVLRPQGLHVEIRMDRRHVVVDLYHAHSRSTQLLDQTTDIESVVVRLCAAQGVVIPVRRGRHRPRGQRDRQPRGPRLPGGK